MMGLLQKIFGGKKEEPPVKTEVDLFLERVRAEEAEKKAAAQVQPPDGLEWPRPDDVPLAKAMEVMGMSEHQVQTLFNQGIIKCSRIDGVLHVRHDDVLRIANEPPPTATLEPGIQTEHEQPVAAAAKTAVKKDGMSAEEVSAERSKLTKQASKLFALESDAKDRIDKRLVELDCLHLNALYPTIDLSILKWRRKDDGWPVFAFFDMVTPVCEFEVWHDRGWCIRSKPQIHCNSANGFGTIQQLFYPDLIRKMQALNRMAKENRTRTVATATFKGIIPDATRDKIKEVQRGKLFDDVMIIAEAPWQLKEERFNPDPLVVGIKHGRAWLIDVFNLTPTEALVKSEFTTGPTPETRPQYPTGGDFTNIPSADPFEF